MELCRAEEERLAAAPLLAGWPETMLWSCLQGCMGRLWADRLPAPRSVRADVGDFSFFAGRLDGALLADLPAGFRLLVPRDMDWSAAIALARPDARAQLRYATRKEPDAFDRAHLEALAARVPPDCRLAAVDEAGFAALLAQPWSRDLVSQFSGWADYRRRGLGVLAWRADGPAAGASSYTVYLGGIEVEADTRPDQRRRGLARACAARLILDCLERGLYPSWDAHSAASLSLAMQLGYRPGGAYVAYALGEPA